MRRDFPAQPDKWRKFCIVVLDYHGNAFWARAEKSNCAEIRQSNNVYGWKPRVCASAGGESI